MEQTADTTLVEWTLGLWKWTLQWTENNTNDTETRQMAGILRNTEHLGDVNGIIIIHTGKENLMQTQIT